MSKNNSLEGVNMPWPLALFVNILIVLGFFFMFNGFAAIIMKMAAGGIPMESDMVLNGPAAEAAKNTLLVGHIGGIIVGMILLPLLYVFYIRKELNELIFKPSWFQIGNFSLIALSVTFVILPFLGVITDWNKAITLPKSWESIELGMRVLEDKAAEMTKLIVICNSTGELLLVIFTVALLPAIGEELVFRGILQNGLIKAFGNKHVAVLISAAVFSFIHFQFFGFFPRMLLGIVLGYLYITSGNILVSMVMHFTNNAMAVIALNLHAQGKLGIDPDSSKDLPIISIYISILLTSALIYFSWKLYKQRTEAEKTNV